MSEMFPFKMKMRLWSRVMMFIWKCGSLLTELTLMEASAPFGLSPTSRELIYILGTRRRRSLTLAQTPLEHFPHSAVVPPPELNYASVLFALRFRDKKMGTTKDV